MVKYSADQSLIQGAGDAYKDYSAESIGGLDTLYQTGMQISQQALAQRELKRQEEKEKELEEQKKREGQVKAWDNVAMQVGAKSGGLGNNVYDHTKDQLAELRTTYLKAIEEGDKNAEMDSFRALDAIASGISDFKDFRNNATNEYSDSYFGAMSSSADENNGMEREIYTHIFADQSQVTTNEKGERVYSGVTENGHEYSMTEQQIINNYPMQESQTVTQFTNLKLKNADAKKNPVFDREATIVEMERIIPTNTKKLRSFLADKISAQNWAEMIGSDKSIAIEANDALVTMFDTNDTPGLQEDEMNILKGALTDPFHEAWESPDNWASTVRPIAVQKLTNAIENKHIKHKAELDQYIKDNTPAKEYEDKGGYIIGGQMVNRDYFRDNYKPFINFIENPKEGQYFDSPRGYSYKYENGKFYYLSDDGFQEITRNPEAMMAGNDKISQYVNIPKGKKEEIIQDYSESPTDMVIKGEVAGTTGTAPVVIPEITEE